MVRTHAFQFLNKDVVSVNHGNVIPLEKSIISLHLLPEAVRARFYTDLVKIGFVLCIILDRVLLMPGEPVSFVGGGKSVASIEVIKTQGFRVNRLVNLRVDLLLFLCLLCQFKVLGGLPRLSD